MDLALIKEFIRPELLILVVFIWCIGYFLKKLPNFKDEWRIPFILMFISVVFTILYIAVVVGEGWSAAVMISAIIQGVLIAAVAVFSNELIKQNTKKKQSDINKRQI